MGNGFFAQSILLVGRPNSDLLSTAHFMRLRHKP